MSRTLSNYIKLLDLRQVDDRIAHKFQSKLHVTDSLIKRLGLEKELEGHTGVLASASDDVCFILWDPFRHKKLHTFETGHHGNIFTVKFLPKTSDNIVVTGAGDCRIRVHDVELKETTLVCSCHTGRVKRVATAPSTPYLFWSAAEDGMVMEFDLRAPHSCSTQTSNVLINFVPHLGRFAEAKCLAINPRRPELLAVGASDPYVRLYDRRMIRPTTIKYPPEGPPRTNWERYRFLSTNKVENNLPENCVQYFVAGHLPVKQQDYKRKYRNLASTYVTFSASGTELLVNLGGEQIYLFDINNKRQPKTYEFCLKDVEPSSMNGYSNGFKRSNGYNSHNNGVASGTSVTSTAATSTSPLTDTTTETESATPTSRPFWSSLTTSRLEALKMDANNAFEVRHYTSAIRLYNRAINACPNWALLYTNRAAAFMKRGWDGDVYAALRDCTTALHMEPDNLKAHFRLAKCLYELDLIEEAMKCLSEFKEKFPYQAHSRACKALDMDMQTASKQHQEASCAMSESEDEMLGYGEAGGPGSKEPHTPPISEQEKAWREGACDYEARYCGHCNTTTDIKEANFFGSEGQYIVAGSDDGSFFIWDRQTTNIVQVLKGDDSIVNCLQPHPTACLLATSGIDPVVRLWSPRPEDGTKNERAVLNLDDAASANQKRMNADPFEVMLINMGYRFVAGAGENEAETEEQVWPAPMNCRPS